MRFDGVEFLPDPPGRVAGAVGDAGWVAARLPGATVLAAGPDRAVWRMQPRLLAATGPVEATAAVVERAATPGVRYRVVARGPGGGSVVEISLAFLPGPGGGTAVGWVGKVVERTGLLRFVPGGVVGIAARGVAAEVWAAVRAGLGG